MRIDVHISEKPANKCFTYRLRKNFNWWEQHFHSEWKNWKALCKACEVGKLIVKADSNRFIYIK